MTTGNNLYAFIFVFALFSVSNAAAQNSGHDSLVTEDDCTDVSIPYTDNPELTRQEKIRLMDQALFHSLNKYEGCQRKQIATTTAGGGGGSNNGQADSDSNGINNAGESSTASSDMSGTEKPEVQKASTGDTGNTPPPESMQVNDNTRRVQNTTIKGGGKIPDDIPPVDNDSVLEAQIRHAAMIETDPVIKEKLWNEYRKYKGLPVRTTQH